MSRLWRIEYEGALYHPLSRGNERSDIFMSDSDRTGFLDAVGEMSERFDMDIFAYVLMDNHYHLLARTRQANLKKAMQWFGTTQKHKCRVLISDLLGILITNQDVTPFYVGSEAKVRFRRQHIRKVVSSKY